MIDIDIKFEPDIAKIIEKVKKSNGTLVDKIDGAVKKTAIELNIELKKANPQKTGLSRRAWMAPIKLDRMTWVDYNRVSYTPLIKYGSKNPSKFVSAPKGVTINPGKPFIDVVTETHEKWLDEMTKQTLLILQDIKIT